MPCLALRMAPDPIFRQKSAPVGQVTAEISQLMHDLLETLHHEQGIGMAAPMAGILKQIVVIRHEGTELSTPLMMADPQITEFSEEKQSFTEASLCFPGISAEIKRPARITVRYTDEHNTSQTLTSEGFLATVIQHEIDYLNGKTFLDYLSPLKRDTLLRKMKKIIRQGGGGGHHHHHHHHEEGDECATSCGHSHHQH